MRRHTKRFVLFPAMAVLTALLLPTIASAQEAQAGEVWVTLKGSDYAKPYLDNDEFDDHEFKTNGFLLVIRVEDVTRPWTFELRPSNSAMAPVTITTDPEKFRATRVSGSRLRRMVQKLQVTFVEAPAEEPAPESAPAPTP